ncbi:MAG: hypothetical protein HY537_03740, partial [Deltaproteobacteria bacterium]|nr:hypothetical protein [Deltaproteobacteria bacterium]
MKKFPFIVAVIALLSVLFLSVPAFPVQNPFDDAEEVEPTNDPAKGTETGAESALKKSDEMSTPQPVKGDIAPASKPAEKASEIKATDGQKIIEAKANVENKTKAATEEKKENVPEAIAKTSNEKKEVATDEKAANKEAIPLIPPKDVGKTEIQKEDMPSKKPAEPTQVAKTSPEQKPKADGKSDTLLPAATEIAIVLEGNHFHPSKVRLKEGIQSRLVFVTLNRKAAALIIEKLMV